MRMMFLVLIFLSYFIGCISTIGILIILYMRYGLYPRGNVVEQEQFQIFHPLNENYHSKNSTIDTINYLLQFLFQELKDTSKLRYYIVKKLHQEFNDFKKTKLGKLIIEDISIQSFSLGKECPIFSDIQLERQERDKQKLIKEIVAKLNLDYKDGFSITLDIKLIFGYKCQLYIKIKRIRGHLRLEFRREPYVHWLIVFQDEPNIDFEIKSYFSSRESSKLSQIITQQIRRIIQCKQTWPSYKIRYEPFFSITNRLFSPIEDKLIPGEFIITIKYCDRLSIPFELFLKKKFSIFLTLSINEHICEENLCIHREQWIRKKLEFIPKKQKIYVKEVLYMNRIEFLIEKFHPMITDEINDKDEFQTALEDQNIFLLQIKDQEVKTLKQINQLLNENNEKIDILVGMPLLHSVQVQREIIEENDQSTDSDSKHSSIDKTTLIMMNKDLLKKFNIREITNTEPETYIQFDPKTKFRFQVGSNQHFLNICLWCDIPPHCNIPNHDKKRVLLGYTSVKLSEIVFDTLVSCQHETQMTLNFLSVYSDNRIDYEKKLAELSTHKGYNENMTHGFVTINIKHIPENLKKTFQDEKKYQINDNEEFTCIDNDEHEKLLPKSTEHIFEDRHAHTNIHCDYCTKTIWMKTGRQCRNCFVMVHKKCEEKFNNEYICTHKTFHPKPLISENEKLIDDDDDDDDDSKSNRSFRRFRNKKSKNLQTSPELPKTDESDTNTEKRKTSLKIVNAAYTKFRKFKTKKSTTLDSPKPRSSSDLTNANISESDLEDIITKCLSDEYIDKKQFEDLFHEKGLDYTEAYARADQFGPELFEDLTFNERKEAIENEIFRLKQEIDLQNEIRDEMIIDYNDNLSDENMKKKIQGKINNIDEKIQALSALTIFYCSSLRYCCSEMECKNDNSKFHNSD